ncbi:Crp/Fnr family transcriptional regulator [Cohnella nanjingensis]|uniref:Crp/Fnr family transcriptional regulator n=1 Tax=Cohnella nanjingensis TaxID=1387779 RepID=A0A7X0VDQ7_9BACL|nr:Crp/Fnr family transcriptional regulator [Cohnella nanjingensis]MBB6670195.1 Crp/Fnr family transcriptional regulator [Cohnella nanjingensis]
METTRDAAAAGRLLAGVGLGGIFMPESVASMELRTYADKERVCDRGELLGGLYVVVAGRLKIYTVLPNGKTMLLRFSTAPMLIGDVEWSGHYPACNSVEASGRATLLFLGRTHVQANEMNNPPFLQLMIRNLSHKLSTLGNGASTNLLYPTEHRVASYLLTLLPSAGETGPREEIRTTNLMEMAELLGTSYRHLNRVIKRLADSGLLSRRRGRLYVLDEEKLRAFADNHLYT